MPPGAAPKVSASAGAMTRANSSGVNTGSNSSRGVRALRASRRRARVATAARPPPRWWVGAARVDGSMVVETVVMGVSLQ